MLTHFNFFEFQCYGILSIAILILLLNILMTSMIFLNMHENSSMCQLFSIHTLNENKS